MKQDIQMLMGKKLLCLRTLEKANELYDFNHKISKMKESDKLI